jgi:hypothetical protein
LSFEQTANGLRFQLATEHRWISGRVQTNQRRLIDLLNAGALPAIVARDVSMSNAPTHAVAEDTGEGQIAIATDRILFAIPIEPESGVAVVAADARYWLIKKIPALAVLGVGPYEIRGHVHLPPGGADLLEGFLAAGLDFFAVTDVSVQSLDGGVSLQERVVVVNRRRVDYAIPGTAAR